MNVCRHLARAVFCAGLTLAIVLVAGCADDGTVTLNSSPKPSLASGNWQISSSASAATHLPALSGTLSTSGGKIAGLLHAQTSAACITAALPIAVSGAPDNTGNVTLTGAVAGGTLTVTGTLAADGKSLGNPTYDVSGGTCAFAKPALAVAQVYTPLSGTYAGSFSDADGQVAQITAVLNQSATADGIGNYTLTGTATLPNNPCFPTAVPISATLVTGGSFAFTYANNSNSVTATGTFSSDAANLTVSNWVSSGSCGADSGTGTMTRQAQ